jgi:hypothetical protein
MPFSYTLVTLHTHVTYIWCHLYNKKRNYTIWFMRVLLKRNGLFNLYHHSLKLQTYITIPLNYKSLAKLYHIIFKHFFSSELNQICGGLLSLGKIIVISHLSRKMGYLVIWKWSWVDSKNKLIIKYSDILWIHLLTIIIDHFNGQPLIKKKLKMRYGMVDLD